MKRALILALATLTAACATRPTALPVVAAQTRADAFFDRLQTLCGKAYAGKLVAFNPSDVTTFGGAAVMHVRDCTTTEVRIPFQVGTNRSRTWIITRTADGLRLKHDHRHEDGSPDSLTMYGGDSVAASAGSAQRQEFPADAESRAMFKAGGMQVSMTNVWAIEIVPGELFAYELRRPGRHFRVDFNLETSLPIPPPAWGFAQSR